MITILVIEIFSESTIAIDLNEKKEKYRKSGVKHYWALKKSFDPQDGLENSFFFTLRGKKYFDRTAEFQESGILKCEDLHGLAINSADIWFSDNEKDMVFRLHQIEKIAEQEKQRADRLEKELLKMKSIK
jgi:hypothetical protein